MECIFCKKNSDDSKSREHIVPESLGNTDYFLEPGWVCDKCNNYLSRKVEAPFLNTEYGKRSRFEMSIPSKRGKVPIITGLHPKSRSVVSFINESDGLKIFFDDKQQEFNFLESIKHQSRGAFYLLAAGDPNHSYETSRFIGKVALEIFAYQCRDIKGSNKEIANKVELNELRNYVRYGKVGFIWPINIRRLYPAKHKFIDIDMSEYEVLNEWNILFIPTQDEPYLGEYYVVLIILGVEYVINLGGPELDGYLNWLKQNNNRSFLY